VCSGHEECSIRCSNCSVLLVPDLKPDAPACHKDFAQEACNGGDREGQSQSKTTVEHRLRCRVPQLADEKHHGCDARQEPRQSHEVNRPGFPGGSPF
jgi:hypothetical protein